jgi:cell wall-associated NlpC family hydrolase
MSPDMRDILHTPYVLGGRVIGTGLDCLGVVGAIAQRRGVPPPDGWPSIRAAWEQGKLPTASGFPAGWHRQPEDVVLADGDVLLFFGPGHPWCAIIDGGHLWSSSAAVGGAYCMPLSRWHRDPNEVWRWQP